jgi:hypothetical protein
MQQAIDIILFAVIIIGGGVLAYFGAKAGAPDHGSQSTPQVQTQPKPQPKVHRWNDPLKPYAHSDVGETEYHPDPGGSRYNPEKQKPLKWEYGLDRSTPTSKLVYEDMGDCYYVRRKYPGE